MNATKQTTSDDIKTKEQFWNEHILLKRKSGLSRSFYCRKHKLNCDNFAYWEQKYDKAILSTSKLLPIKLDASKSDPSTTTPGITPNNMLLCALTLKNGNELKVYDKSVIPTLLSALG
jgi:hypothetical protein